MSWHATEVERNDDLAARRLAAVARLRLIMTDQADRLDDLVDRQVSFVHRLDQRRRADLADTLASAALVAQAARDLAARRIDHAEYERRLNDASALLPSTE